MNIIITIDKSYDISIDYLKQHDIDVIDFLNNEKHPATNIPDVQDDIVRLISEYYYSYYSKWCEQGYQIIYFCNDTDQSLLYQGASIASGYFEDIYIVCLPLEKIAMQNLLECVSDMIEKNVSLSQIWQVCSDYSNSN